MTLFLSSTAYIFRITATEFMIPISDFLHQMCLSTIPSQLIHQESAQALICAKNFTTSNESFFWAASGLIHLFVVSGTHLNIISKIFEKLKLPIKFTFLGLFLYVLICKMNPPILRSFIFLCLQYRAKKNILYWPTEFVLLMSGLLCLLLNYKLATSVSLQMSWLAALFLQFKSESNDVLASVRQQAIFYLGFLFIYFQFGFPAGPVVIFSVILTPVLELFLFPLSLMVILFNFLSPLFDFTINLLLQITQNFELNRVILPTSEIQLVPLNWMFIAAFHIYFYFKHTSVKGSYAV